MFTRKTLEYIGDISQIGGIKKYVFSSGKSKGVEAFDVNNGNGLLFTVLADRGLDICHLSFKGIPVSFISKTGIVSPYFYNEMGDEWFRSFTGGFLTTCGVSQVGEACVYEGNHYGLHGNYSNLPADEVSIFSDWSKDEYLIEITGKIRQAKVHFENLVVKRTIRVRMGINEIELTDEIVNEGTGKKPFMLLYHINFGYPLLNKGSEIILPSRKTSGFDKYSQNNIERHLEITEPVDDFSDLAFLHDLYCDEMGLTRYMITDNKDNPNIGVSVEYDKKILSNLVQWIYLCRKDYVMALEPCNNMVRGLEYEHQNGTLKYIQPDETIINKLHFKFLSSEKEIADEKKYIKKLKEE